MSRGGTIPDATTRRAAGRIALLVGGVVPAVLVGGWLTMPAGTFDRAAPIVLLAGLPVVVTLLALARGARWRVILVPAFILYVIGPVGAAELPAGQGVADICPFCGAVLIVAALDGRELKLGIVAAWVSGAAGMWLARSNPAFELIPSITPAPIAVVILMFAAGLGYFALWWAASHWHEAMRAAEVAEASQARIAERFRAMADNSPVPTLAFDTSGIIHSWNPAAERFLGWTAEEAIGRSFAEVVPPEARNRIPERVAHARSGLVDPPGVANLLRKDGSEVRAELYDGIERGLDGLPAGVVVQFLDVSEREAMAMRLVEAQRLEAVGQLAGGIAHDFNNSLTAITGFASLIASGDSPDPREDARTIQGAAERAAALTRQLLAFARRVPLHRQLLDLQEFVSTAEPMVRSLVGETIASHFDVDGSPALVEVDPPSLEQAILNLAANARDAMPKGGDLTITVGTFPGCTSGDGLLPEDHVGLCVSDTGEGIPEASIDKVFEPFFTTKAVGKGTGLGLAMVHGFVAQSGGHVVVSSPPGRGATFELHFPPAAGAVSPASGHSQPVGGGESILYVEDDRAVASFGLACLRRLGYDVTPALQASEAVAIAAERAEPFDLLLTDIVIPGMSGRELAELIHRHHPTTAILYASGYSPDQFGDLVTGPDAPLLEKPYSLAQLASKVREVLDARAGEGTRAADSTL